MEVLDRDKILPKEKAQMSIPFCRMISMHVMKPTLKIDVLKMEHAFHMGYKEVTKFYMCLPQTCKGKKLLWMLMRKVGINTRRLLMMNLRSS
jgi:hypothetical protein